jgi:uncharacterized membrane protein YcaP (DUF421 family)
MKPEELKIDDWSRIFVGEVPPEFFLEVIIRVTFLYFLLILSMRLLGKRMSSQLTRNELAALVSLAAAIGVPILSPDRGLLPAIVIALVVVLISRLNAILASKSEKTESIILGKLDALIKDAVIDPQAMRRTRITRERIMSQLRAEKVFHLGEVQRLYMEANGNFTLIKSTKPAPGLPVLPEQDQEFLKQLKPNGILVCHICGMRNKTDNKHETCPNCKNAQWVVAVETAA